MMRAHEGRKYMKINWYPGHMFKANKELAKLMQQIDVVIEVLDARMPAASANPMLEGMRSKHHKPCVHVLNKADLADPKATAAWINYFNSKPGSAALINGKDQLLSVENLLWQCQRLVGQEQRKYNAVICGIPNVGKSTLMNQIAGRKLAKTGNEPAVTKAQQRIKLNDQWYLFDTPGVLWPKLEDQDAAHRLACAGAIRNTAIVFEDVAFYAAEFLLRDFPDSLKNRYGMDTLPDDAEQFMTELAGKRGCRGRYGGVDWHKVSEILLHDYREGKLGRLTLEPAPPPIVHKAKEPDDSPEPIASPEPSNEEESPNT